LEVVTLIGKIVSINVSVPREVFWNDKSVKTSILKNPVAGRIVVDRLGLEGGTQADLTVHGGPEKALYAYPVEHYEYWKRLLEKPMLPYGMFGENLTTQGVLEYHVHVGDRFRIGSAEVVVTQPRFPCYKVGMKFGTMEMVKRFQSSGRSGFYLAVAKAGEVCSGDSIELASQGSSTLTIAEIFTAEAE
jgi:MOSC domain-containing protein YiiM